MTDMKKVFKNSCSMHEYSDVLRKNGFRYLDSGCYGSVYAKDDVVVKVCRSASNTAYLEYVEAVRRQKSPPSWLPKIDAVFDCVDKNGERWFAVQLERLDEGDTSDGWGEPTDHYRVVDEIDSVAYATRYMHRDPSEKARVEKVAKKLEKLQPGAKRAIKVLAPLFERHNPDVHPGNIMRRKNGEFVITDPVC